GRITQPQLEVGEVAQRDIRASSSFQYIDWEQSLEREREAESAVQPVYDFDAHLSARMSERIHRAFEQARAQYAERLGASQAEGASSPGADASPDALTEVARGFLQALELSLDPADLQQLTDLRWSQAAEARAVELVALAMGRYIVA